MRICLFGNYNPDYNRTRVLIKGLEAAGATVLHCHEQGGGLSLYARLFKKHRELAGEYDVLFVAMGTSRFLPSFARFITRKPLVWEPLFSIYDNWVFDRKYVKRYSLKAFKLWLSDWLGCKLSDLIILDTKTHALYFIETFSLSSRKLAHVSVGTDPTIFYPKERTNKKTDRFEIEFHGKYIPLHGTETIMRAAKLLEEDNVHFTMIGAGQEEELARDLVRELNIQNVSFLPFLDQKEITTYIAEADACIGMVGDVPRIVRSIPNKMWETAAMARVSITADTSSLREIFTPGIDVVGVKPGDVDDLVQGVRNLIRSDRSDEMGQAAYQTFLRYGTPDIIGNNLLQILKTRLNKTS